MIGKVKSLGVIVDEGLTWNDQFKSLTGKLEAGLLSLKKLRMFFPSPSFVMSILLSLRVIYATETSAELQTLQRLQNRALSIIASARYKDPWPKNWLNVENLILFDHFILTYKIFNQLCPESFWNMFQLR